MTEQFANQALTTLTAELAKGATSLTVALTTRFPAEGNFRILIDSELMMVTAVEGTTFTVERGIEGTADISHANGSTVLQVLTAGALANKADLDEGTLRESEIPSSVVTDSRVETHEIWAEALGMSALRTGKENSEILAEVVALAEEKTRSKIILPSGTLALNAGVLLNKADDEGGSFQYLIQGDGRGTLLDLEEGVDWLFRLNCTEADEAASATGNLIGRLQLRDLMIRGVEKGETGLVRTIGASVQMVNVRGEQLNRGVYQISGYTDHHTFENVRWKADPEAQSWFFETKANGDGHVFTACTFASVCKAGKLKDTNGAVVDSCIGGFWEVVTSTGVEFRDYHVDNAVGQEAPAPWLRIEDSRVRVSGGFLLVSQSQPLIEVDDPEATFDGTQLILDGTGFGWRNGDPDVSPPRHSHIHIAAASSRSRFIFESPRGFTVNQGTATSDPVGVVVTSDDEGIQAAIDAAAGLLNGGAVLIAEYGEWRVKPMSVKGAERYGFAPAIPATSAQTGIGGTLAKGTTRYYRIAVWDGFQWSNRSEEGSVEATKDDSAFVLVTVPRSVNSTVRVWRGPVSGEYDGYCDITVPTSATRLVDTGEHLSGLPWVTEAVPTTPEGNAQRTVVELAGNRILFNSSGPPSNGEWGQGDICFRTDAEAGKTVGFICVESGPPSIWKAFATAAE